MGYKPRIIPCLLLENGRLVKTLQFSDPVYIGDPINTVRVFNDLKADELVFLDITASQKNKIEYELIRRIATEAYMPFSYGGGVNSIDQAAELIANGVEKIIIGAAFFSNPQLVREISDRFGAQAVAVCLDYRIQSNQCVVYTGSGKKQQPLQLLEAAQLAVENGAGEIIVSAIDKDGTMSGYDHDTISLIASKITVPIIALGGARDLTDLKKISDSGASAAAAGSLFCFLGSRSSVMINYPDKEELSGLFYAN